MIVRFQVALRLQRAWAAVCADLLRSAAVSFFALAGPPFNPPSLPRATAAGFLEGLWSAGSVTCRTIEYAVSFKSFFVRERLGMTNH